MEAVEQVSSPADLSASFTPEVSAPVEAAPTEAPVETEPLSPDNEAPADFEELNAEAEAPETADEEQAADEAEAEQEVQSEPADQAVTEEPLPEGVRKGKDRNGKDGYWLNPNRYESFHGAHKTLQEFASIAGGPITREEFDLRHRAFMGQERLYTDLLSGDPQAQSGLIQHFFEEAKRAQEEGDVAGNPMVPFTQAFYQSLRQDPDAYSALRQDAAKDLVTELYQEAAAKGDKNLYLAMGHVANILGLPFKTEAEMPQFFQTKGGPADPAAALRAENESLKSQLNGRSATSQAAQFDQWKNTTKQAVSNSILNEAVFPSLAEDQKQGVWAKRPDAFDRFVTQPLHSAVVKTMLQDKAFNDRIELLDKQAKLASARKREEISATIQQLYKSRAMLAVEAHRPKILADAAALLKESSDATHRRLQSAQTRRAPAGGGTPVKRSLVPSQIMNGDFEVGTPDNLKASLNQLLR